MATTTENVPKCDKGHPLHLASRQALSAEKPAYAGGFNCDRCGNSFQWTGNVTGTYHCRQCEFDMCPVCMLKAGVVPAIPQAASANTEDVGASVNEFGWRLLGITAAGSNGNTFISPFSITQILSLVAGGADTSTLAAMKTALAASNLEIPQLASFYATLNSNLRKVDADVIVANSTWTRPDYKLLPEFQVLAAQFCAEAFALPSSPTPINDWCAKNTRDRIKQVLDKIQPDDIMVLVNALYFKGLFRNPFDPKLTHDHEFTNGDNSKRNVRMMRIDRKMQYAEDNFMQAVVLDYGQPKKEGSVCCVIVLPKPKHTVDELLQNTNGWRDIAKHHSFSERKGTLMLPRFKAETDLQLKAPLAQMGMQIAFTGGADFSKLCQPSNVCISSVIHKTFLEVNEKGTEAAAVTAVTMMRCCAVRREDPPFQMVVDRPFLFCLVEKQSHVILFVGKIAAPQDAASS